MKQQKHKHSVFRTALEATIIIMLLLSIITPTINSVIIEPGYEYNIGNETYRVNAPMNFSRIYYTDTYIVFNNTGINITAPDNILITLRNLNGSTAVASNEDELFEFEVLLDSGTATMSISGFATSQNHTIYKDASLDTRPTSNGTGCIDIAIASGASNIYTIYYGGTYSNNPPNAPIPTPADNSSVPETSSLLLKVFVSDNDNDTLNVSFYWPDGSLMGTSLNNANNSYATISIAVIPGNRYRWYVIVSDGIGETRGPVTGNWTFTVKEEEEEEEEEEEPDEPEGEVEELELRFYLLVIMLGLGIALIIAGIIVSILYEGLRGPAALIMGIIMLILFLWTSGILDAIRKFIISVIDPYLLIFIAVVVAVVSVALILYFRRIY